MLSDIPALRRAAERLEADLERRALQVEARSR